jgi:UDP-N-acetylmuramoyl-L-alanyl-D-glutamate--2,6-diaminopimelate ligase
MGGVAVEGADVVVVTDDDPHGEDPAAIRAEVLPGAHAAREAAAAAPDPRDVVVLEVAPRARAIHEAIAAAGPHDTVLVAGRGHEVWQEIAGVDHPLDDRVEARAALERRDGPSTPHEPKEHHG